MTENTLHTIAALVAAKRGLPGALLPILHDIQDSVGYIPPEAVGLIARELNLSSAEVHGVLTFYHHFRDAPPGRHVLQVCRAEACQSMGGERLWQHALETLQPGADHNSADGAFSVEAAYCLGLCSCSPAVMLDEQPHARMDNQKLDRLLAAARSTT